MPAGTAAATPAAAATADERFRNCRRDVGSMVLLQKVSWCIQQAHAADDAVTYALKNSCVHEIQQSRQMRILLICTPYVGGERSVRNSQSHLARVANRRTARATTARRLVVELLAHERAPDCRRPRERGFTPRIPRFISSTVYRTLDSLREWGLAEHVHRPNGASFFHLSGAHHHVECDVCGRICDVPTAGVRRARRAIA